MTEGKDRSDEMLDPGDYVLGTGSTEQSRLGLQHRAWRPYAFDAWRRAGVTVGSRVLDVGAGPGYASLDLAEIVGERGEVLALERSRRFVELGQRLCAARGLAHASFRCLDLMTDPLPAEGFDVAWMRWVASFVSAREPLVQKLAAALRPGGRAVLHEYASYATWRLAPRSAALEDFVRVVMDSWRETGGEPDVALELPRLLDRHGFRILEARPLVFAVSPAEHLWQWPATFAVHHADHLVANGHVTRDWARRLRDDLHAAANDVHARMVTPMVLEIIAELPG